MVKVIALQYYQACSLTYTIRI